MNRKLKALQETKTALSTSKTEVDQIRQHIARLRDGLEAYSSQYDSFVGSFQQQIEELNGDIRVLRHEIQSLLAPPEERTYEEEAEDIEFEYEQDQFTDPLDDDLDVDAEAVEPVAYQEPTLTADEQTIKKLKRFFAKRWHPNVTAEYAEEMIALNQVLATTSNPADVLAAIPWDEEIWLERAHADENVEDHWGRLNDWLDALDIAKRRIEQEYSLLEANWQTANYREWEDAGRDRQYFAAMAEMKRQELVTLKEDKAELEDELALLMQEKASAIVTVDE